MSRVDEAKQRLEDVFAELASAIRAATNVWDEAPAPDEWSPRLVAEHIVSAAVIYLDFAADTLRRDPFDWLSLPYEFTTSQVALDGLAAVRRFALSLLNGAGDSALGLAVPAMEDWPNLPNTVEGAFGYVEAHGAMHARQIRETV